MPRRMMAMVHPLFQFELQAGTLFVFAPLDDLFFCHETEFVKRVLDAAGAAGHRFAFVFRWLKQETAQRFDAATGAQTSHSGSGDDAAHEAK